jgi:hypothetical protein
MVNERPTPPLQRTETALRTLSAAERHHVLRQEGSHA